MDSIDPCMRNLSLDTTHFPILKVGEPRNAAIRQGLYLGSRDVCVPILSSKYDLLCNMCA